MIFKEGVADVKVHPDVIIPNEGPLKPRVDDAELRVVRRSVDVFENKIAVSPDRLDVNFGLSCESLQIKMYISGRLGIGPRHHSVESGVD